MVDIILHGAVRWASMHIAQMIYFLIALCKIHSYFITLAFPWTVSLVFAHATMTSNKLNAFLENN